MISALIILGLLASAEPARSTPAVDAAVFAARPSLLGVGQLLGPSLTVSWLFDSLVLDARLRLGFASENDPSWRVLHSELHSTLQAGWIRRIGPGELSLRGGLGVVNLEESRTRHQSDRLAGSGLELSTHAWSVGSELSLEAGVRLLIWSGLSLVLDLGPNLLWFPSASDGLRVGWAGSLGLAYVWPDAASG